MKKLLSLLVILSAVGLQSARAAVEHCHDGYHHYYNGTYYWVHPNCTIEPDVLYYEPVPEETPLFKACHRP